MADKVKGITIEFRGNATPLQKAIREVNKDITSTTKELSQINKALKFNPTSVELWRQKQDLLKKKVEDTTEKLETLKKAQKQMDAAGVDKTSAEYRKLQREIIETSSQLKTFKGQLASIGNVNLRAIGEGFKKAGEKATTFGTSLTKNVTAPIVAVGAASIKAFNEVKEGLNIVAQKTGATGDELKDLQDSARSLAKTIPASFEETGTAIGEVNTRFNIAGKELEKLSGQYVKFAKVNSVDLNNSIDQTQKALAAWGAGAESAPKLLDTLTRASQKTGASVDTLTEGLIQNATAYQELGLSIDQSVMFMAQVEKSGVNSETAMQGLRKALKNAAQDGKPLNEALAELQNTIKNGNGSVDGLTAAYDLFGKSGDQIYGAVKNGTLDFKALGQAVEETGGTLDDVFNETLTPAEKFQTTLNSVKDAGYEIGGTIMQVLEPALQKTAEAMKRLSEWWGTLSPEAQEAIAKAALVAAAIGPVVLIIGKLFTAIGSIITVLPMMGAAITALTSGPLLLIVGAIAAVIAIGVALYKNWDTIKAKAQAVGQSIKATWNGIKTSVSAAIDNLRTKVTNAWENIKTSTKNSWQSIKDAVIKPFTTAKEKIDSMIEKIKNLFPIDIGSLFSDIKLPHFSWDWIDVGGIISIPSIDIDWYDKGGIFKSPSVIGVGEKRPEFVGALDDLRQIVREEAGIGGEITINVYASEGMNVNELALKVEQRLVQLQKQRTAAYGGIQ